MLTESYREGDTVTVKFSGNGSRTEAARHARRYTYSINATRDGVKHVRHSRLVFAGSAEAQQTTPTVIVYRYRLVAI